MDSLYARSFSSSRPAPVSSAKPATQPTPVQRLAPVKAKPPQILQSGHAPAQLSFTFTRW